MRRAFASFTVLASVSITAACSSSGANSTFSAVTGGAGGAGAGVGAAGGGGPSTTQSSSQATTTSSSQATTTSATSTSATTTSSSTTSTTSSSGTGGGPACTYDYPNTCNGSEQLTQIDGDSGSDMDMVTGTTSKWFSVIVNDSVDPFSSAPESFTATLVSPPGMQFDLYAYEAPIGMTTVGSTCSSAAIHAMGDPETITDQWPDNDLSNDSRFIVLEVRYVSGTGCGMDAQWTLVVAGHTQ